MPPLDLSILIVSYNTRELTLGCLESLYRECNGISFEVIVVDNDSPDGSAQAVERTFPDVKLLRSKENLGFAKANNVGAQLARGQYLLLLNPDTVVLDRAAIKLLHYAKKHPKAGIWGGKTLFADGSLNATCCYNDMTPWSLFCRATGLTAVLARWEAFNSETFGNWDYSTEREVQIVTGCFLLTTKHLWENLSGFNPRFFMFGEEVDFCRRARALGYRPRYTPEAQIIHYGGASDASASQRMPKVFKGKATVIRVHWGPMRSRFGIMMLWFWAATRAFALSVLARFAPKRFGSKREMWVSVWKSRGDWIHGFAGTTSRTSTVDLQKGL